MTEPTGYEKSRSDLLTEAVKASLVVNGGGSVAILAFVQSIWNTNTSLRNAALTTLLLMTIAIFLSLLVPMLRYHHSKRAAGKSGTSTIYWRAYMCCLYASPGLFLVGIVYLTSTAWAIQ